MNKVNSRFMLVFPHENNDKDRTAVSAASTPDAKQNEKTIQLLSEDPIVIPHNPEHFEEDPSFRRDFWLSWLAYATVIIPAMFILRWLFIGWCGGHAPDFDYVVQLIHHLNK